MALVARLFGGGNTVQLEERVARVESAFDLLFAAMQRFESQNSVVISKLEDLSEVVVKSCDTIQEIKGTHHIGKKVTFLPKAYAEAESLSLTEIRSKIKKAAKSYVHGPRLGYRHFYARLEEVTGIDVYAFEKVAIGKLDGLGVVWKDPAWLNVIFKKGIHKEAYLIATDMLREIHQ